METKKNINIWKSLQKVPAGTMFVPLIIGAIITTICQGIFDFDLWGTLGNPMKDMFSSSGQMLIIGLMLFCTGTQLKLSDMADALHRGVLLILVRLGVAYGLCALFYALFGYEGFLGISFLAFVCAVTSANAALYMGIISPFGDKADKASFGIMLICSMPLLPLLFLGFYGEAGFGEAQVMQIISLIIPFILGMVLGNMDMDIRKVFAGGNAIILPFLGFEFGSTINLIEDAAAGPADERHLLHHRHHPVLHLRAHGAAPSRLRLRGQRLAGRRGAGDPQHGGSLQYGFRAVCDLRRSHSGLCAGSDQHPVPLHSKVYPHQASRR